MNARQRAALAGAALFMLGGCKDMGLQELKPRDEATQSGRSALVEATMTVQAPPANHLVNLGGSYWMATPNRLVAAPHQLRSVGAAAGSNFFRLAWDEEPFDRVYAETPQGLMEYRMVY